MIDKEKIKLSAIVEADKYNPTISSLDKEEACRASFMNGAQWAQKEFVKSLWHPASEEPEDGATVLIISEDDGSSTILIDTDYPDWKSEVEFWQITKWLYLDDILPKKGGEE